MKKYPPILSYTERTRRGPWFTADTHFGHSNIIKLANRPFSNVEEMNTALIENWNSVIAPTEKVYFLGDFAFKKLQVDVSDYFNALHGEKHLIIGNHDYNKVLELPWESVEHYKELVIDNTLFVLMHYPIRDWNGCYKNSIHLYGHVHGSLPDYSNTMDIGVDNTGFKPVNIDQIKARLKLLPKYHKQ